MSATPRILYIDDDPDTRFLLREMLADLQNGGDAPAIDWLDAGGVEEALAAWSGQTIDTVLLDNRLAGEEGVNQVAALQAAWKCPVWVVSGAPDRRLLDRAQRNGASGLLGKDELLSGGPGLRSVLLKIAPWNSPCQSNP